MPNVRSLKKSFFQKKKNMDLKKKGQDSEKKKLEGRVVGEATKPRKRDELWDLPVNQWWFSSKKTTTENK